MLFRSVQHGVHMLDSASASRCNHEDVTLHDAGWTDLDVVVEIKVNNDVCPGLRRVFSGQGTGAHSFEERSSSRGGLVLDQLDTSSGRPVSD